MHFINTKRFLVLLPAVMVGVVAVVGIATAATTISTNIQTDGTLSVTGQSTFTGNVGIGTSSPATLLDVEGSGSLLNIGGSGTSVVNINNISAINPLEVHSANAQGINLYTHADASFRGALINLSKSRGTQLSPTAVQSGDNLSYISFSGYDGSTYATGAQINALAAELFTPSAHGTIIQFQVTNTGSVSLQEAMRIAGINHGLGIGTTNPLNKLDVFGAATIGSYAGVNTAPANGLIVSGNVGIGTTTPQSPLQVTAGASATTTVTIGSLGLTSSKGCVNMNQADGSPGSFYLAGGVMKAESNYCR